MIQADDWYDEESLSEFLAAQLRRGRLSMVLGAGISVPFGLPNWDELLDRMFTDAKKPRPTTMTLAKQAEVFRLSVSDRNERHFRQAIRKALYRDVDTDFWVMQPTLAAVAALVMASRRGSASHVVTFNFDDILEMYLEFHGFVVNSIVEDNHWAESADVSVYHPHGCLPLREGVEESTLLVLDQMSFSEALHGEGGRLWRQELLTIFRSHTCVFVGIGEDDAHLESLMLEVKRDHVSSNELPFWAVRLTDDDDVDRRIIWEERGVANVVVRDFEKDLPARLLNICQLAAKSR